MADFFKPEDCDCEIAIGYSGRLLMPGHGVHEYETKVISLARANELLRERGKVVYANLPTQGAEIWLTDRRDSKYSSDTHQALLVNVEEIAADSAEKVVRDLVEWESAGYGPKQQSIGDICERAKRLERARKLRGAK